MDIIPFTFSSSINTMISIGCLIVCIILCFLINQAVKPLKTILKKNKN